MLSLVAFAKAPELSSNDTDGRVRVVVLAEANGHALQAKLDGAIHAGLPPWVVAVPLNAEQSAQLASGQGCRAFASCVAHYLPPFVDFVIAPALAQTSSGTVLTLTVQRKGSVVWRSSAFVTEPTLVPFVTSLVEDILRPSSPELRLATKADQGDAAAGQQLLAEFPDSAWLEVLAVESAEP